MKKYQSLIWFFGFLLISGCTDVTGGGDGKDLEDEPSGSQIQVYNADGTKYTGDGTAKIRIIYEDDKEVYLDFGAIQGGKLLLDLPLSVNASYLMPFGIEERAGVSATPADFLSSSDTNIYLFNNAVKIGELLYCASSGDFASYNYYNNNVVIDGTYTTTASIYEVTADFKINAKTGWNKIFTHQDIIDTSVNIFFKTDVKDEGFNWILDTDMAEYDVAYPNGGVWRTIARDNISNDDARAVRKMY